jgi:hypothetical protein
MVKDAVEATPETTKKVFENDDIRVLEVTIKPGQKEPLHIHKWKGEMVIIEPAKLRYYDEQGKETRALSSCCSDWRDIKGPHSSENIDSHPFKAYRIESKK